MIRLKSSRRYAAATCAFAREAGCEAQVIADLFPSTARASSTKGWTGHTLGAAGIVEAVISFLVIDGGYTPGTLNARELDPACGPQVRLENEAADVGIVLSNSFGFGGSNCSLVFGRSPGA